MNSFLTQKLYKNTKKRKNIAFLDKFLLVDICTLFLISIGVIGISCIMLHFVVWLHNYRIFCVIVYIF